MIIGIIFKSFSVQMIYIYIYIYIYVNRYIKYIIIMYVLLRNYKDNKSLLK